MNAAWRRVGLFFCRMGWHSRRLDYSEGYHLIGGGKARCPRCGEEGLVDSQGNLF